jgi:hypothetical protein
VCGATLAGDDLAGDVARAVDACELFVVLGTENYGVQGESSFSTRQELQLAVDRRKPIFLIKRCDEFADPLTQMYLPASMMHREWYPSTAMPEDLLSDIVAKLAAGGSGGGARQRDDFVDPEQMCVCV